MIYNSRSSGKIMVLTEKCRAGHKCRRYTCSCFQIFNQYALVRASIRLHNVFSMAFLHKFLYFLIINNRRCKSRDNRVMFIRRYVTLVLFLFDNVRCRINGNCHSQPIICEHFYVTMAVENFLILKKILMFYGARARF
jgi:hypothetical protein